MHHVTHVNYQTASAASMTAMFYASLVTLTTV